MKWLERRRLQRGAIPVYSIDQDLTRARAAQSILFRHRYANGALIAMAAQLLISDGAFLGYLIANDGKIPGTVMDAWLGAGVVQVIGVVMVITKNLFPEEKTPESPSQTR